MLKSKYYTLSVLAFVLAVSLISLSATKNSFLKTVFAGEDITKYAVNDARAQVVNSLKGQGDDSAIKAAEKYLVQNPNDTDILNLIADVYIKKNNLTAAEGAVNKAIAIKPNDPFSSRVLANIYALKAMKNPADLPLALEQVNKALINSPDDVTLLMNKVKLCLVKGDLEKANAAIDKLKNLGVDISRNEEIIKMKQAVKNTASN